MTSNRSELIADIIRDVAELPDRNSPDDWPEAMLVTADELRDILVRRLSAPAVPEEVLRAAYGSGYGSGHFDGCNAPNAYGDVHNAWREDRSEVLATAAKLSAPQPEAAQTATTAPLCIVCKWDGDTCLFIEAEIDGESVSLQWHDRPDGLKELRVDRRVA